MRITRFGFMCHLGWAMVCLVAWANTSPDVAVNVLHRCVFHSLPQRSLTCQAFQLYEPIPLKIDNLVDSVSLENPDRYVVIVVQVRDQIGVVGGKTHKYTDQDIVSKYD